MSFEYEECRFENDIESYLLEQGGYTKAYSQSYDADKALDLAKLVEFIKATQPKQWRRYKLTYPEQEERRLVKRFNEEVTAHGLLHVLRNGIRDRGVEFKLVYFKPESDLNPELVENYQLNNLTVTRQFRYSTQNNNTIDMVLSLNGIPLIALELKNQLTGQSVEDAKEQFMTNRNAKELCFQLNKRFLVYFAVDHHNVVMTTQLKGRDTFFLPFNQGSQGAGKVGGAGNPPNPDGYVTSYLWEKVLTKDSLLNIIHKYIHLEKEERKEIKQGKEITKRSEKLIFPRYHQLDVVNKLIADVKDYGSGKNYLIQHSAGSGKSNSIAWMAYRLAGLHDARDNKIFTSVIVVTDRRVLDDQLQATISSFDHKAGLVETIDDKKSSKDLRDAINSGKKIIVTTLQKFPVIYEELDDNVGKTFAVIVDEAHSSQTGSSAQKLKAGLADSEQALAQYAEIEGLEEAGKEDFEDKIVKELITQGKHDNLSFFAFTATPKEKTLEMFGEEQSDGTFKPFHIYSMRQAIEEGFIHDVLKNYMTYETCYQIARSIPENPELEESEARKAIKRYESLHPHNLQQKTAIIIETFRQNTAKKIGGRAKAMVVTPSRLHAVRYFKHFKQYIELKEYDDLDVLVAFSGSVQDRDEEHTEIGLNRQEDGRRISEKQLPAAFHSDEFNILVVAEKYQTGFDEPLLHTMFVDKKLSGVKAVQTLSRLNRITKGKEDTLVIDFVNSAEDIQASFAPFYEETTLDEAINVNLIYETQTLLQEMRLYGEEEITAFYNIYYKAEKQNETDLGKMLSMFLPILERFKKLNDDDQFKFKKAVRNFVKWYAYIIQITRMFDKELQKEYSFLAYLNKVLPTNRTDKIDLSKKIELEYWRLDKTFEGQIIHDVKSEDYQLSNPKTVNKEGKKDPKRELLDNIINEVNERFGGTFTEGDKVIVETMFVKILSESNDKLEKLRIQAKNNTSELFQNSIFPKLFNDIAHECYEQQVKAFSKLFEDKEFYKVIMNSIGRETYRELRSER